LNACLTKIASEPKLRAQKRRRRGDKSSLSTIEIWPFRCRRPGDSGDTGDGFPHDRGRAPSTCRNAIHAVRTRLRLSEIEMAGPKIELESLIVLTEYNPAAKEYG